MYKRESACEQAGSDYYDLIIVGGGIHGAAIARSAALRGFRVLLLEKHDFAFGTSSRSSKMLHGGVRYLETGNLKLVRESLLERAVALNAAGHLSRPQAFYYPVIPGKTRPAWQIRIGLTAYDWLSTSFLQKTRVPDNALTVPGHERIDSGDREVESLKDLGLNFNGLFRYFDGQMDDARMVVETVVDAVDSGANCINYAQVISGKAVTDRHSPRGKHWAVRWRSEESGEEYESRASYLVNASGPWAPVLHKSLGFEDWSEEWPRPVYSRGTHLIFNTPWPRPGLIMPTDTKGRYYFIWPLFGVNTHQTLVGTTDVMVDENEEDPIGSEGEKAELLGYLQRDLPGSGLNSGTLMQSYAGMRILGAQRNPGKFKRSVSSISRSHHWLFDENYAVLLGGKFTSSRNTAEEFVERLCKFLNRPLSAVAPTLTRQLPGGMGWSEQEQESLEMLTSNRLREIIPTVGDKANRLAKELCERFGMRTPFVTSLAVENECQEAPELYLLRLQTRYCYRHEFARRVEDVLRRRLSYTFCGKDHAEEVAVVESELRAQGLASPEGSEYLKRWHK